MKGKVSKVISKYCPICEEEHEVKVLKIVSKEIIKNEEIEYEQIVYECEECNEYFEDGELLNRNLDELRDAYRRKKELLTAKEIIEIRNKFNLTQEDLAIILGLGEKTIARYETSTIQDKPYDILLRKFNEDYNFAYEMLEKSKGKIKEQKFSKIKDKIIEFISKDSNALYNEIQLKNRYINENEENSKNGFSLLNINKIKSMLAYFAKFTKNLFTVKLMKLFWYSDSLSYLRTGHSMTGLIYTRMPMGALPIGYKEICELDSVHREPDFIKDGLVWSFISKDSDNIDDSLFSIEEMSILAEVCKKFENVSGTEISKIMHEEDIYINTDDREILDYSLIKNIKAF